MFGHDNQDDTRNDEVIQSDNNDANQDDQADAQSNEQADDQVLVAPDNGGNVGGAPQDTPSPTPAVAATTPVPADPPHPAATDDLLDIKQEALEALTPLVGQLDQTPEEQFRTTMMMIQASDNHSLVKVAYGAAQHISNEKERAQALLDIVNEINYFTQHTQA